MHAHARMCGNRLSGFGIKAAWMARRSHRGVSGELLPNKVRPPCEVLPAASKKPDPEMQCHFLAWAAVQSRALMRDRGNRRQRLLDRSGDWMRGQPAACRQLRQEPLVEPSAGKSSAAAEHSAGSVTPPGPAGPSGDAAPPAKKDPPPLPPCDQATSTDGRRTERAAGRSRPSHPTPDGLPTHLPHVPWGYRAA